MKTAVIMPCLGETQESLQAAKALREALPRDWENHLLAIGEVPKETKLGEVWPRGLQVIEKPGAWWAQCIRAGMEAARGWEPDWILWLNQDTVLEGNIGGIMESQEAWVAGCRIGNKQAKGPLRKTGIGLRVCRENEKVDTLNGNLAGFPKRVWQQIKPDGAYQHQFLDVDYGLEITRGLGERILQAGWIARTAPQKQPWRQKKTLGERWCQCMAPTGLPPREWLHLVRKWDGILMLPRAVAAYRHLLLREPEGCPHVVKPLDLKVAQREQTGEKKTQRQ
jgi:hypothetical protein